MDWKLNASKDPEMSLNSILAKFKRLAGQGFTLPEEQKAMSILRGIPSRWDSFAGTILATAPVTTILHLKHLPFDIPYIPVFFFYDVFNLL